MDDTELHYVTYDPDAIMNEMLSAYMDAGGEILYPGDEKSMLLNAVQAVMVQAFAGVDNALRMGTLRYAVGDYLDVIGETRGCTRIAAVAATATANIVEASDGITRTLEAGLALSDDSGMTYTLDSSVTLSGSGATVTAAITCTETGEAGNGLTAGSALQFLTPQTGVSTVTCGTAASGGADEEEDDDYRERIRTYNALNITTGTALQYEAAAKAVTTDIIDANAIFISAGYVQIVLLMKSGSATTDIISAVTSALNSNDARPLTDTIYVTDCEKISYTINVVYEAETGVDLSDEVADVIEEYQDWQDNTIGQTFNPDKLMALLYQAGCTHVTWGDGSEFNGGDVKYTKISNYKRCLGTITATREADDDVIGA